MRHIDQSRDVRKDGCYMLAVFFAAMSGERLIPADISLQKITQETICWGYI
jgi:hypothetical protein